MGDSGDPWGSPDSNATVVSSSLSNAMKIVRSVLKFMIVLTSWMWTWWGVSMSLRR